MIRSKQTCPVGHLYVTIKPSYYDGKAAYPQSCPECKVKRR